MILGDSVFCAYLLHHYPCYFCATIPEVGQLLAQDGDISAREEALRKREAELLKREERVAAAEATLGVRD